MSYTPLAQILREYGQVSGDRRARSLYRAQHPQLTAYERLNEQWQVNSAYGRFYSLLFHTAAMRRRHAAAGETEAQGAHQLEASYRPAAAP
jgi:hypothetical protein